MHLEIQCPSPPWYSSSPSLFSRFHPQVVNRSGKVMDTTKAANRELQVVQQKAKAAKSAKQGKKRRGRK